MVNERTRLPIVLVANNLRALREQLASTVTEVFGLIGAGGRLTTDEVARMGTHSTASASNGAMEKLLNEYADILRTFPELLKKRPAGFLNVHLAITPMQPFDHLAPLLATQRLLSAPKH